jgi:hypothetical protein
MVTMAEGSFEEAARLLSRNYPDSPPEHPGTPEVIARAVENLPALMKARRGHLGLSMLAVANATNVPMMTYRRFELGECDRLRLPHIVRMLRWLAKESQ